MVKIEHNGSRFAGQAPASLEALFLVLANHPLCRGHIEGVERDGVRLVHAWGNFDDVSHGFGVTTDDPTLAARFVDAFAKNRGLPHHPCMGDGPSAKAAERCPCWEAHFGRFQEEGDPEPEPPPPEWDRKLDVAVCTGSPDLAAKWKPLIDAELLRPCTDELRGGLWHELSGSGCFPPPPPDPVPTAYDIRKRARIDGMRSKAARLRGQAAALESEASRKANMIPLGQPILVGHHSEKRDRRFRERIRGGFVKAMQTSKEAADLERRAKAAESNRAVSSDDPNATSKLREKLAKLEKLQASMVDLNRRLRAGETDEQIAAAVGTKPSAIAKLREPDFAGRTGIADYQLKNNGAEIRRLKKRIAELDAKASAPEREPEQVGDVRIAEEDNRVRLYFPGKPPESVRDACKSRGFRWSPSAGAWQRHASEGAWYAARELARMAAS